MKLTTSRQALATAATFVGRVVRPVADRPLLSNVRVEVRGTRAKLSATNGDTSLETVIDIAAGDDGVTCVPAKHLVQVLNGLDGDDVTASTVDDDGNDTGELRVVSGGGSVALRAADPSGFPAFGAVPEQSVDLDAAAFTKALAQVLPAASTDQSRVALTGVQMVASADGLRLVATDSYRLAIREVPGVSVLADGQQVLAPAAALSEVSRLGDVEGKLTLHLGESEVVFAAGQNRMRTRLLSAEYPDVDRLIPTADPKRSAVVERSELLSGVKLASTMATGSDPVKLAFDDTSVNVTSLTDGVGWVERAVDAKTSGGDVTVAFNPDYLVTALNTFSSPEVRFEMNESAQPVIVRADDDPGLTYLVMPIRSSS